MKKFDVVIGNPPYQSLNKGSNRKAGGAAASIYPKFILRGLEVVEDGGYFAFITPPAWGKRTNLNKKSKLNIFETMVDENTLLFLNQDSSSYFNVATKVGYHIIRKNIYDKLTIVENSEGTFKADFRKLKFIPNKYTYLFESIYHKVTCREGLNLSFKNEDPRKHNNDIPMWKNCVQINYLNGNSGFNAFIRHLEINPKRKNSQANFCICNSLIEAQQIKFILNSKLFKFLNLYTMQDPYVYHNMLNTYIIPNDFLNIKSETDIYSSYSLTQEEIGYIEERLK